MKHITRLTFLLSLIAIVLIIRGNKYSSEEYNIYNTVDNMNATVINNVIPYSTEYSYNSSKPESAEPIVIQQGINGLSLSYGEGNSIVLNEVQNEIIEVGTAKEGDYTGRLTGYGADCAGCSSVGNVSCLTREGTKHSLINDGMIYNDYMYGNVRILSADTSAFPCGTVINVENDNIGKITAVVLDTGYSMRNAWSNGQVWIDLAFVTQEEARNGMTTNDNTKFSVQRWGW